MLPCAAASSGDLEPTSGESRRSHRLRIGRYNQHFVDALAFDENPVEYLMNKFPEAGLKPEGMRAMLGRFGLSGHHHLTPIVKLSGEGCWLAHTPCVPQGSAVQFVEKGELTERAYVER